MARLLLIYHSRTGGTAQMAHTAYDAARLEVDCRLMQAENVMPQDVMAADGYIFAAPENLAALSGLMKEFFDRCYYPLLGQIEGRPYAQMICAGSDGAGAVRQLARIAQGWRLKAVQKPLILVTNAQSAEAILAPKTLSPAMLAPCEALGQAFGAGLAMGIY